MAFKNFTLTATAGNDNKTINEPNTTDQWVYTWDGLGGTDTLSFDRLSRSEFDIYMDVDGIHVDSIGGASHMIYVTLTNVERLSFNDGATVVNLATLFDTTAPTISSLSPTDEATGVQLNANLVITFNESVKKGSGNIVLKESNGTVVATYSAATSSNLSFSGSALTINPTDNLVAGKTYVLEIASGAVTDLAGNAFVGISTYNFSTVVANSAPTGTPVITGTPTQGNTLTASNTLADADGMGTVSYQWQANGADIGGASGSTLVLGQSLVGKVITLKASYTDGAGKSETVTSSATTSVANVNDSPTGNVSVNGSLVQGSTLTASNTLTDADEMGTVSYQWQADGADIGGATGSTLVLGQSLVGKSIRVKASYTDGAGQSETVLSESTASVLNVNDAPLLNQALTDQSFHSTQSFNLTFPVNQFADADGDNLSMIVKLSNGYDLPTWLVLNPAMRTLSALAGTALVGRYELRVTVSDGQYTATDEFFIDVTEPVDLVAPIVVDVEPVNQANGIQIDASIVVQFDEPIRVSDLANDFVLRNVATSELIDLTISVSGYAVTLDPVGLLQGNSSYEVVLKSGSVQDFSGNEFTGMQGWQFTTASDGQTMQGSANADQFHSSQGNDTIQGGLGIDTVEYSGQAESYQITSHRVGSDTELSTMTVHDGVTGRDGIDQLSGIEKLVFADKTLNLMVKAQSLQISESAMNRIAELYVAFFNRVPDGDGMSYWMGEYKNGKTINQIADSFYNAGVYFSELTGYRADMTDSDFIHTVYRNVLGRPDGADEGGLAHWTAELSSGRATKGTLVSAILDAAHGVTFSDPANAYHWVQTLLDNKLDLAKQVAIEWGLNYNTSEDSITQGKAIAAAVTPTGYEQAIELVGLHWQEVGFQ